MGARAARAGVMLRNVESLTRLSDLVSEAAYRHASSFDVPQRIVHVERTIRVSSRCAGAQRSAPRSGDRHSASGLRRSRADRTTGNFAG